MKKLIFLIMIIIPIKVYANTISAESYTVMDMDTNRVLVEKNGNEKKLIASTSKIITT